MKKNNLKHNNLFCGLRTPDKTFMKLLYYIIHNFRYSCILVFVFIYFVIFVTPIPSVTVWIRRNERVFFFNP